MKKILTLISLIFFLAFPSFMLAQEANDSTTNEDVTQKIKDRLQETAEAGLDDIKDEIVEKSTAPRKKAYIGSLTSIKNTLLELEYKSIKYTLSLDEDTNIVSGKKTLDVDDLESEDFIIALGFLYHDQTDLKTQKVSVVNQPEPSQARQLLAGPIEEIDGSKITVAAKTLIIGSKTDLAIQDIEDPTTEDLELADNLFAIVTLDKNGDIDETKSILVIPGKNNPASQEPTNATDSATATDSAETDE